MVSKHTKNLPKVLKAVTHTWKSHRKAESWSHQKTADRLVRNMANTTTVYLHFLVPHVLLLHFVVLAFIPSFSGSTTYSPTFSSPAFSITAFFGVVFSMLPYCLLCRTRRIWRTGVWNVLVVETEGCGWHKRPYWEEGSQKGGRMILVPVMNFYCMLKIRATWKNKRD